MPLNLALGPQSNSIEGLTGSQSSQSQAGKKLDSTYDKNDKSLFNNELSSAAEFSDNDSGNVPASLSESEFTALLSEFGHWLDQNGGGKPLPEGTDLPSSELEFQQSLAGFLQTLSPQALAALDARVNALSPQTNANSLNPLSQLKLDGENTRNLAINSILQGLARFESASDSGANSYLVLAKELQAFGNSINGLSPTGASLDSGQNSSLNTGLFPMKGLAANQNITPFDAKMGSSGVSGLVVSGLSLLGAEPFETFQKPAMSEASNTHQIGITNTLSSANGSTNASSLAAVKAEGLFNGQVELPVESRQWGAQLANRLSWMVNQGLVAADLHLTPPELGPMQVRIDSHQDRSTVTFVSQHAATREAIEASLPRLKELFSAQGLDLLDVDVQDDSSFRSQTETGEQENDGNSDSELAHSSGIAANGQSESSDQDGVHTTVNLRYGIVDAYA